MNLFDAAVVIFGFVEIILASAGVQTANLNVLRCFRLLRVFKLARSWKELNRIMNTVLRSLNSIGYLSLLMGLFIFIMAVLGMQFFGYALIFCDQYGLGASVQPACPIGLSVEAGTCPKSHYYDCYAPCDPSQVGQWIGGNAPPDYGPPGPTGYCKAYGPTPYPVSLKQSVPLTVTAYCSLSASEVLSGDATAACGAAFQAFSWYKPLTVQCNASDASIADTTSYCGLAYSAFAVNSAVSAWSKTQGGTLQASLTADGASTVVLNSLPVTVASSSLGWVGSFAISYVASGQSATKYATCTCAGTTATSPCVVLSTSAVPAYCNETIIKSFNGSAALLPAGPVTFLASDSAAIIILTPLMATSSVFSITYPVPVDASSNPLHVTSLLCRQDDANIRDRTQPCGAAYAAFSNNQSVNSSLVFRVNGIPAVGLLSSTILILNSSLDNRTAFRIAYLDQVMYQGLRPYVNTSSELMTTSPNILTFNQSVPTVGRHVGGLVPLTIKASLSDASGNFLYGSVDATGRFQVTYIDGSQNASVTTVMQYQATSEFWMWIGPAYIPRANFDDFLGAFLVIFQIISTENWNNLQQDVMRATHYMTALYFIFVFGERREGTRRAEDYNARRVGQGSFLRPPSFGPPIPRWPASPSTPLLPCLC